MSEQEIAALSSQPIAALRRKDIRSPIAGRVIERLVSIGQPVGGEGQAKELYVISDLSVVEVELAVPPADLGLLREGQDVRLQNAEGRGFEGKITYVNAMITRETRSGHVLARFANPDFALRPGSLLEAEITLKETPVKIKVPRSATMIVDGKPIVFVRTANGFAKRAVDLGRGDEEAVEVVSGSSRARRSPSPTPSCSRRSSASSAFRRSDAHRRAAFAGWDGRSLAARRSSIADRQTPRAPPMIKNLIAFSVHHRWLIVLLTALAAGVGMWSLTQLPIDAVPDITNNQVQINAVGPRFRRRDREAGHLPDRDRARRHSRARIHALACRATASRR